MKLFLYFIVVSLVCATGSFATKEMDVGAAFLRAMEGTAKQPKSFSISHLLQKSNEDGGRRLQCSDYFCEDNLCFSADCCGADSITDCDCDVYVSGDLCRSCYVCSNENISFDCSDEVYGDCVGQTCSESCISNPRPTPSAPSAPNPRPTPSAPSTPSTPSAPSAPSAPPPSPASSNSGSVGTVSEASQNNDDSLSIGLIVGIAVAGAVVVAVVAAVGAFLCCRNKNKNNHYGTESGKIHATQAQVVANPPVDVLHPTYSKETTPDMTEDPTNSSERNEATYVVDI